MIELIVAVLSVIAGSTFATYGVSAEGNPVSLDPATASADIDRIVLAPAHVHQPVLNSSVPSRGSWLANESSNALVRLPLAAHVSNASRFDQSNHDGSKLDRYMELAAQRFDPRVQGALSQMPDEGRRLLAIKYYARRTGNIASRWAMTTNQIARYRSTREHRAAVALVKAIQSRFAELNPGFRLKVNTDVRTLEDQIELWNSISSTAAAGSDMVERAERELADSSAWPETPSARDAARFERMLESTRVSRTPTAAVPGFSLHGNGRAFDFIVCEGDKIIAGADAGSARGVWDKPEWTAKLKEAVASVSDRFEGPLMAPYEPWHYSYSP